MFSINELIYLLNILDYYESGLVRIIKYYINTYTFIDNIELKKSVQLFCHYKAHKKDVNNNGNGNISYWDVLNMTSLTNLFYNEHKSEYNIDITRWNINDNADIHDIDDIFNKYYKISDQIYLTGNPQITFFKVIYKRHQYGSLNAQNEITR